MSNPFEPTLPPDMRDLLIRLDQQVKDGFLNINNKLDEMNRRADGHETRIRDLERDNQVRLNYVPRFEKVEQTVDLHENRFQQLEGAQKGVTIGWKVGSVLLAVIVGIVGYMTGHANPSPQRAVQQVTVAAPAASKLP